MKSASKFMQMKRTMSIREIEPAAENCVNTRFIVLEKQKARKQENSKTCMALVADETASVHFQFWGDQCDAFDIGDIADLTNGIFSYIRNNLVLRAGKRGKIEKVGEFTIAYVESPNMSEVNWMPHPSIPNKLTYDSTLSPCSRIFPPSK